VRPNPYALTHAEIFGWLVEGGGIAEVGGPTRPLLSNGELLQRALDELSVMVGTLEDGYRAGSVGLARRAIDGVSDHVRSLAGQAPQVANGFDGYLEAYHEARARVPRPLPFADQIDVIQERGPGVLAQIPVLAQLEEEHNARTREAQEVYRRLDQAAVAADDATPEFPLMFEPVTTGEAGVVAFDPSTSAGSRPATDGYPPPGWSGGPTSPAGSLLAPAPGATAASSAASGPAASTPVASTSGTAAGGGLRADGPAPVPPAPPAEAGGRSTGYNKLTGLGGQPGGGRPDRVGGRFDSWLADRAGRGVGGGTGRGFGPEGGGFGPKQLSNEAGSIRGAGAGRAGTDVGPMAPGGRRGAEDREHRRASYLEEAEDPHALFGTDQRVAPPVIGE